MPTGWHRYEVECGWEHSSWPLSGTHEALGQSDSFEEMPCLSSDFTGSTYRLIPVGTPLGHRSGSKRSALQND